MILLVLHLLLNHDPYCVDTLYIDLDFYCSVCVLLDWFVYVYVLILYFFNPGTLIFDNEFENNGKLYDCEVLQLITA